MVEQLGFAIILSFFDSKLALISGTINFFDESILHADELSITVDPTKLNLGAHSIDKSLPAEKRTIFGFNLRAASKPIIS